MTPSRLSLPPPSPPSVAPLTVRCGENHSCADPLLLPGLVGEVELGGGAALCGEAEVPPPSSALGWGKSDADKSTERRLDVLGVLEERLSDPPPPPPGFTASALRARSAKYRVCNGLQGSSGRSVGGCDSLTNELRDSPACHNMCTHSFDVR